MKISKSLSFETGSASPRTTAIAMAFAAALLLAAAVFMARIAHQLDVTGLRAEAEVVNFREMSDDMRSAVFQFIDAEGKIYRFTDSTSSTRKLYTVGEKVTIVYDKDNPSNARIDQPLTLYTLPLIFSLLSVFFFAGAALVWRFRSHLQKDYEARRGKTVVTVVSSDGSVTQRIHSSVPVFRWTGYFLGTLGTIAWLVLLVYLVLAAVTGEARLETVQSAYFGVLGGLLLAGAWALLRHARYLQMPDRSSDT
ncbi:MAG: DUF3592 domain-containing protein [Gammaproteobacteria bacterium]|nr:DUF3592 domain-containing protein [Gammaproteobacteria bacterium]